MRLLLAGAKGGVGRSTLAASLACAVADMGRPVVLVDADVSLATLALQFDRISPRGIRELTTGTASLRSLLLEIEPNLSLLAGDPTLEDPIPDGEALDRLREALAPALLADLRAGDAPPALILDAAACPRRQAQLLPLVERVLIVSSPDLPAEAGAFASLRELARSGGEARLALLVNQAANASQAQIHHRRLQTLARERCHRDLPLAGWVPSDLAVLEAARARQPLLRAAPASHAARAIAGLVPALFRS